MQAHKERYPGTRLSSRTKWRNRNFKTCDAIYVKMATFFLKTCSVGRSIIWIFSPSRALPVYSVYRKMQTEKVV